MYCTAHNTATHTAELWGRNSDPIHLKQSININIALFSGNQIYVFDKILVTSLLARSVYAASFKYLISTNNQCAFVSCHDSIPV